MSCNNFLKSVYKWTTDFLNKNSENIPIIRSRSLEKIWCLCVQILVRVNLNPFQPMFRFYTPWKHKKTSVFHVFMGYRGSALVEKLTPIYIREKKFVSRQFTYFFSNKKTVFIKKLHTNIEINGIQYWIQR